MASSLGDSSERMSFAYESLGDSAAGASINGTFSRFAEIVFDHAGGEPAVKQVYKLISRRAKQAIVKPSLFSLTL